MPLTPLQERVARLIAELLGDTDSVLVGGAGLIAQGLVDRTTRDLDYFGSGNPRPGDLTRRASAALEEHGLNVQVIQDSDSFGRLIVGDGNEETEVDFGVDVQLFAPVIGEFGSLLSPREAAVNKILAIFNRTEVRDAVDLAALIDFFPIEVLLDDAAKKDLGLNLPYLLENVRYLRTLGIADFDRPADFEGAQRALGELERVIRTRQQERSQGPEIDF
jgi:hypothetical protein